jgi:hypothetical protein
LLTRIKHQLFQNQDSLSELTKDVEITLKQLEDEHRIKERELKTDIRSLQINLREQELSNNDFRFALKVEHDKRTTMQRQEFERLASELKKKYALKMDKQRAEMEEERMRIIKALEDRKDDMIKSRTSEHAQKYTQIKTYYSDIIATNLDFIKQLRIDISDLQQKEENERKKLNAIERERRELQEPQKQLEQDIRKLEEDEKVQAQIMEEKEAIKAEIDEIERAFREMEYEYEVKVQSLKYLQKETSKLSELYSRTVHEVQQKAGLNNLILEKKLANIQNDLEVKDIELNEYLLAANIDPRAIGSLPKTLDEVLDAKKDLIASLENQLQQIRRAHSHMIKAYEGKLSEFVIPIEELGFDPLAPTLSE